MKQLLPFFLFLLPCLAWAQYPSNGNQKITLGEQTTADGLIYRGVLADTGIITPSSDTSAYIILDTVNHRFYNYNRATNVWSMAGVGSISSGLTGVLPVANGGTGSASFESGNIPFSNGTILTSDTSLFWDNTNKRLGISFKSPAYKIDVNSGTSTSLSALRLITSATSGSTGSSSLVIDNTTVTSNIGNSYGILMKTNASATGFYVTNSGILGVQRSLINNLQSTLSALSVTTERTSGSSGQSLVDINSSTITGNIGSSYAFRVNTQANSHTFAILNNGNVGIGQTTPTAVLHLKTGTATASTAPLKFTSGTNLTTAEAGAMEFNGTNLFFSPSTTRHTVNHGLTGSATLDFPSTTTLLSADLTITVTGAADGDVVSLGVPNAAVNANTSYSAWVSAANTVTVRFNNYSSGTVNPASGSFKVFVTK
jgi:hypothetical protein